MTTTAPQAALPTLSTPSPCLCSLDSRGGRWRLLDADDLKEVILPVHRVFITIGPPLLAVIIVAVFIVVFVGAGGLIIIRVVLKQPLLPPLLVAVAAIIIVAATARLFSFFFCVAILTGA